MNENNILNPGQYILTKPTGFTLIELMVVIGILALLMAIAIPNFIHMRNKGFCSEAETDANHIAMAISNYYGNPNRTGLPVIDDLKVTIVNSAEIIGDPNATIVILVTDRTGRCPESYTDASDYWKNSIFHKHVR
jgi:type IV pilus assembly protein PilA